MLLRVMSGYFRLFQFRSVYVGLGPFMSGNNRLGQVFSVYFRLGQDMSRYNMLRHFNS
jgi:hypothetical protein